MHKSLRALDDIRSFLGDAIHRTREMRADLERHDRRIHYTYVLCIVYEKLSVHYT